MTLTCRHSPSCTPRFVWRKLASAKWSDAWEERLRGLDPARLAIIQVTGNKGLRLEYYCTSKSEAESLRRPFGGSVRALSSDAWKPRAGIAPPRVLRFGSRLVVTGHEREVGALRKRYPDRRVLCIPAALAFGSGEHATTSMCLSFLVRLAANRAGEPWDALDLGTGSGILAIAARSLGARTSTGIDFDPICVRTARENARRNGLTRISFGIAEVLAWKSERRWHIITANLFLNVLAASMPKLQRALAPGGDLIVSGLLVEQIGEILKRAKSAGFIAVGQRQRGRWCAIHFRSRAKRVAKQAATR